MHSFLCIVTLFGRSITNFETRWSRTHEAGLFLSWKFMIPKRWKDISNKSYRRDSSQGQAASRLQKVPIQLIFYLWIFVKNITVNILTLFDTLKCRHSKWWNPSVSRFSGKNFHLFGKLKPLSKIILSWNKLQHGLSALKLENIKKVSKGTSVITFLKVWQ